MASEPAEPTLREPAEPTMGEPTASEPTDDELAAAHRDDASAATPCPGQCGFVVTWHKSHCCRNCKLKPGKHGPLCKKRTVAAARELQQQAQQADPPDGWYPGKHLGQALGRVKTRVAEVKAAKAAGTFDPPKRPLRALRGALRQKRPLASRGGAPAGELHLTVLGGTFRAVRAYFL